MLIILSPAKIMNMRFCENIEATEPLFNKDAKFLAEKMRAYSPLQLESLLKVSSALSQITYRRYQEFGTSSSVRTPALFAYDGSVFKAISATDLTPADIQYAQDRIRIISTLYGLLRPLDLIEAYRIAFSLKLDGISGNLYDYWHNKLSEQLIKDVEQVGGVVVNLASLDVMASLDIDKLSSKLTIITPEFKELRAGKYEVVRTYAKMARGAMTRFIIKQRAETPKSLTTFEWKGYKFNAELSDAKTYIYTR